MIVGQDQFVSGEGAVAVGVNRLELFEHVFLFLVAVDVNRNELPHDDFQSVLHLELFEFDHHGVVQGTSVGVVLNPLVVVALLSRKPLLRVCLEHFLNQVLGIERNLAPVLVLIIYFLDLLGKLNCAFLIFRYRSSCFLA